MKLRAKKLNRSLLGNVITILVLLILGVFMLLPMLYTAANAFKPVEEFFLFPPKFYAVNPTGDNFLDLYDIAANQRMPLLRYIFNTVIVAAVGTVASVVIGLMGAYVLAKHRFPGKALLNKCIVVALLYSGNILAVPRYLIIAKLGWLDTTMAVLGPILASTLGIFLLRQFVTTVPDAMLESARIDGAGEMRICFRIIAPSVRPAIITVIIFNFQSLWNSTGSGMIFTESKKLLPAMLSQITASGVARAGPGAAGTLLMLLPPVIVFVIFQNKIIETMSNSGIKE